MGELGIGVLGPFRVEVDGRRVELGGRRQERLLALLLVNANRALPRHVVIDALWEDAPPPTVHSQVHNAVARLRRVLGDARAAVVTEGTCYRLDIADDRVDATRFTGLVRRARALTDRPAAIGTLAEALGLWRGAAFAGFDGGPFEAVAADLEEQRLAARELLIDLRLDVDDTEGLAAELAGLVAAHPLREALVRRQMAVLHRDGRQADALRVYERARARLADELGVDPGPELRALHQEILCDDVPVPPSRRFLPRDIADFTGRADEVDRLRDLVTTTSDTAVVITALDGMPGVGKTTLAVRVGHLLAGRYPDGQLFLDLHGHTPGQRPVTPEAALDVLLRDTGVPPEGIPDGLDRRADLWRARSADRRMLVVLDNAADAAQVRPLLPGAPDVRVLVTSRVRLAVLEGVTSFPVPLLPPSDAVELFTRVAGRAADDARAAEVVALCGYLPLAIRIAASRLRHRPLWTVAHLAGLLRDEGNRLAELELGDRSVAAAFAVSYEHLGAVGRESFRLLGLFPGSTFDARAAAALTGAGVAAARKALEDLVDANLLVEHAPDRFHFHDLLRQYARTIAERDCTAAERHEAVTRLAAHYLDLAAAADHLLDPGQSDVPASDAGLGSAAQARAVIEAEHRNFGPVLEAVGRCGAVASELAQVAGPLLLRQGYPDEALAAYRIGLAAARDAGHRSTEADLHRRLGLALIPLRRLEESLRELRAALAIEEETGNAAGAGRVHSNIGIACIRMGRFDDALANLRRGLELLREFGTRRDLVAVLVNLGVAHLQVGDYPATIECVQQVLVENEQLGNQYVEANGVLTLGLALTRMGELDQALGHVRRALALSRELGAAEMEARSLYSVADCLRLRSELDEALVDGRASLVLAREIGNRDVENHALIKLGAIHLDRGDLDAAAGCFEDSLRLNEQNRDNHTTAMAHDGLARVAHARGDRGAARQRWESALAVAEAARLPLAARIREDLLSVS